MVQPIAKILCRVLEFSLSSGRQSLSLSITGRLRPTFPATAGHNPLQSNDRFPQDRNTQPKHRFPTGPVPSTCPFPCAGRGARIPGPKPQSSVGLRARSRVCRPRRCRRRFRKPCRLPELPGREEQPLVAGSSSHFHKGGRPEAGNGPDDGLTLPKLASDVTAIKHPVTSLAPFPGLPHHGR